MMSFDGESEFAGGAGMIQKRQEKAPTPEQELWMIYATDPSVKDDRNVPSADKVAKLKPLS